MSKQAPLTDELREVLTAAGFVQDRHITQMWSRRPGESALMPGHDWVCFGETSAENATVCLDVPVEALKALLNAGALAARNAELEGALRPFASLARAYERCSPDVTAEEGVRVSDLRKAHTAVYGRSA